MFILHFRICLLYLGKKGLGMKLFEDVEERVKTYEDASNLHRCTPNQPIIARIHGRGLLKHLKNLNLAFDDRIPMIFDKICDSLIDATYCDLAHHRWNEILLVWNHSDESKPTWLDGNIQQMCSVISATASNAFSQNARILGIDDVYAIFECHIWTVPELEDVADVMLWQEVDNAPFNNWMLSFASTRYNHDKLHGKSLLDVLNMLSSDGAAPDYRARRGTYIRKVVTTRPFTPDELATLPPKQLARALASPKYRHISAEFIKLQIKALNKYTIDERIAILFGKLERKVEDSE